MENKKYWTCYSHSCNHTKFELERTSYDNRISLEVYKKIALHALEHLVPEQKLYGSIDLYKWFEDGLEKDGLLDVDKATYEKEIVWKLYCRMSLIALREKGYLEILDNNNWQTMEYIGFYNKDLLNKITWRRYKRTESFYNEYPISYNNYFPGNTHLYPLHPEISYEKLSSIDNKALYKIKVLKMSGKLPVGFDKSLSEYTKLDLYDISKIYKEFKKDIYY